LTGVEIDSLHSLDASS